MYNIFYIRGIMASLTLVQTRTANGDGSYTVSSSVSTSVTVPREIFMYKYSDNAFDHVAIASDIFNYPTTPTPGAAYYRTASVTLDFSNLSDAETAAATHKSRAQAIVTEFQESVNTWVGTDTITYT